jgi:uncharacterized membrane protein YdfJ with MMPL/SSD domain
MTAMVTAMVAAVIAASVAATTAVTVSLRQHGPGRDRKRQSAQHQRDTFRKHDSSPRR